MESARAGGIGFICNNCTYLSWISQKWKWCGFNKQVTMSTTKKEMALHSYLEFLHLIWRNKGWAWRKISPRYFCDGNYIPRVFQPQYDWWSWAEYDTRSLFLSGVELVWIKTFPSSWLVAIPRLKTPVCLTIYS